MQARLLLASVVLAAVLDGICFKTFQLFRRVQRGLVSLACPSLKQSQQSFHRSILVNRALAPRLMLQRTPADVTIADEASSRRSILQTSNVLPQARAL